MLSMVLVGIGVGALVGIIAAMVALGRAGNKNRLTDGTVGDAGAEGGVLVACPAGSAGSAGNGAGNGTRKKPALTSEQRQKLDAARKNVVDAKMLANRIQDDGVTDAAYAACEAAESVLSAMREQPEEIRRAKQLFAYYLPTLGTVLEKFRTLEENGKANAELTAQTKTYLVDMQAAFGRIHDNMFKDEELDLSVEIEAMQQALQRDGLR